MAASIATTRYYTKQHSPKPAILHTDTTAILHRPSTLHSHVALHLVLAHSFSFVVSSHSLALSTPYPSSPSSPSITHPPVSPISKLASPSPRPHLPPNLPPQEKKRQRLGLLQSTRTQYPYSHPFCKKTLKKSFTSFLWDSPAWSVYLCALGCATRPSVRPPLVSALCGYQRLSVRCALGGGDFA